MIKDNFADVSKARAAYKTFTEALATGREIMRRAGVAEPPPIPDFDAVYRHLTPDMRQELYRALAEIGDLTPAEAIRIWQPLIRRAFS